MGKVEDEAVVADAELQGGQRGGGPWGALGQGPLDDEADEEMGGADVAEVEPTDGADPAAGVGGVGGDEGGNPAVGDVDRVAMGRGRGATETGGVHCGGGRRRTGLGGGGGGAGRAGGRGPWRGPIGVKGGGGASARGRIRVAVRPDGRGCAYTRTNDFSISVIHILCHVVQLACHFMHFVSEGE